MAELDAHFGFNPFLWQLPGDLARDLKVMGHERSASKGQVIHGLGDPADGVYALNAGRVRMSRVTTAGRPLTLTLLYPGSWFGDISSLLGVDRTDDAIADTDVSLCHIPKRDFIQLLEERPDHQYNLLRVMAARLQMVLSVLEDTSLAALPQRLARRLLALQAAQAASNSGETGLPVTQQMLADMMGVTRENVARVLGDWKKRGWTDSQRGQLFLRQAGALHALLG